MPVTDDRYFTTGTDTLWIQDVPVFIASEYEQRWPWLTMNYPDLFSINLSEAISTFITSISPHHSVSIPEVFEFACHCGMEWDGVMAPTGEFAYSPVIEEAINTLFQCSDHKQINQQRLAESMEIAVPALLEFLNTLVGVFVRIGAPVIENYGFCYRLSHIDEHGNVYFKLTTPSQLFYYFEGA